MFRPAAFTAEAPGRIGRTNLLTHIARYCLEAYQKRGLHGEG